MIERRKILAYAAVAAIVAVAITWFAFFSVAIRKAFELSDPWQVVGAYLVLTGSIVVVYRLCGFHRHH